MEKINIKESESLVAQLIEFNAGNFTGRYSTNHLGMMTGFYEVCSYGAVIAFANVATGFKALNDSAFTHSVTTSKHANIVRRVWGI